jgi:hypothetical protein
MRVVGVRANGDFPCSRCFVSATEIPYMGTASDRDTRVSKPRKDNDSRKDKITKARNLIYGKKNYAVDAEKVEALLKPTSLVPSTVRAMQGEVFLDSPSRQNAFSDRLSSLGFDIYDIAAVDILHEVEIGVWKGLFTHLIRLLEATGTGRTEIVDRRCAPLLS